LQVSGDTHQNRFGLTGRLALVTGASRGLGWEIAKAMAEAGANVLLNGRDESHLAEQCAKLTGNGLSAEPACFDITDEVAVADWLDGLEKTPDILVNNAGQRNRGALADNSPDDFSRLLDVNLKAAYALARALAPGMVKAGGGAIINITSIAGPMAGERDAAYTATKGGLEALTRSLAVELGPHGIRSNAIAPGFFATEANADMVDDPEVSEFVEVRVPMARWGEPHEIAGAAVFLASEAASYINGQVLAIDGGHSVKM